MYVDGWAVIDADEDPFREYRPEVVSCPDAGWQLEYSSIEINTGECNYFVAAQPLMEDVFAGETIVVNLWHQPLHADEPAYGHAALMIGDTLVWEREVAIPSPANVFADEVVLEHDLAADERMVFLLHNHGANSWNLGEVSLR